MSFWNEPHSHPSLWDRICLWWQGDYRTIHVDTLNEWAARARELEAKNEELKKKLRRHVRAKDLTDLDSQMGG